jgi:hypothetical protein
MKPVLLKIFSSASMTLAFITEFLNVKYNASAMPSYFPYGRWVFLVCAVLFASFIWKTPKFTVIPLSGYIGYFIWKAFYLMGTHLVLCIVLYILLPIFYVLAIYRRKKIFLWLTFAAFVIPFISHAIRIINNFLSNPLVSRFVESLIARFSSYQSYINKNISVFGELAMLFIMFGSALFILSIIMEYKDG